MAGLAHLRRGCREVQLVTSGESAWVRAFTIFPRTKSRVGQVHNIPLIGFRSHAAGAPASSSSLIAPNLTMTASAICMTESWLIVPRAGRGMGLSAVPRSGMTG
jgi:hypothetical protein